MIHSISTFLNKNTDELPNEFSIRLSKRALQISVCALLLLGSITYLHLTGTIMFFATVATSTDLSLTEIFFGAITHFGHLIISAFPPVIWLSVTEHWGW